MVLLEGKVITANGISMGVAVLECQEGKRWVVVVILNGFSKGRVEQYLPSVREEVVVVV